MIQERTIARRSKRTQLNGAFNIFFRCRDFIDFKYFSLVYCHKELSLSGPLSMSLCAAISNVELFGKVNPFWRIETDCSFGSTRNNQVKTFLSPTVNIEKPKLTTDNKH